MRQTGSGTAPGAQHVLIVDDEAHNRKLLETILAPEGYLLESVASGEAALAAISVDPPDLILLDVMMPGMNGFEVTERLKAAISTRNIPVILVTAMDDRSSKIRGLTAGAEDFVTKPVDRAELTARVRNLLRFKEHGDFHDNYSRALEVQVAARTDALLVEQDRAQQYLDTAAVMLLALDPAANVTMLNRQGSVIVGWNSAEIVGRNWFDVCVPESIREASRLSFAELLSGHDTDGRSGIRTRSGEERLIEWHNALVRDEAGAVIGVIKSGTDVTEHQKTAVALQLSEERMRFAFENAQVGVWDMDCATQAVRLSSIFKRQYGIAPGTFGGTFEALVACLHPDDRQKMILEVDAAMLSGNDFSIVHRSLAANGEIRTHIGSGRFVLGVDGKAIRGVGISTDVTKKQELERQNLQAQKMEAVGRLAAGVAHDFNNLLCVVLGWTGLALDEMPADDPSRASLDHVVRAGEAAARLTKQLLAFSRQQVSETTTFNPNEVVVATEQMLRRLIGENIRLVSRLDPKLGSVRMDRGQLDQVLMNLVVNARDAMPDGGTLTIETASRTEDARAGATNGNGHRREHVVISVTDSGTGMSDDVKARIFEPFFTTKASDKGTGLGLATCYGIIADSGGHIEVRSELGRGTTFEICLPRIGEESSMEPRARRLTPLTGVERILVIEDEEPVRGVIVRMLEAQRYRVHSADGSVAALKVVSEVGARLDLVLIDLVLGGGTDGRTVADLVLEQHPDVKIVFISGYMKDRALLRGKNGRDVPLLQKPFTADVLSAKIRAVLDDA